MRAAIVLAGFLAVGSAVPAVAADAAGQTPSTATSTAGAPDCATANTPAGQLVCRDPALAAAAGKLDAVVRAFADETGEPGKEALASGQRMWVQRRDAACPVTEADLNDPKKAKDRAACLARQYADRASALDDERAARRAPVADQPVTITEAAPPRAVQPPPRAFLPKQRQPGVAGLAGRWAKADPATRTPIDDCRSSYLEISKAETAKDMALGLHDPRIAGLPVEGRVTVEDGGPGQGIAFRAEAPKPDSVGIAGTLRLDTADMPRLDRLFLRLDKPIAFGATFVRCR
ncbi:lysozyme inhibitor LprI family protein [Azospirillum rugosum]|uniref:Uncharacterized protein YecT (DUF1311 family) n=1 Tax=Azospirillum rugosum TaxID=416170 RepID=A0ABS4SGP8_9PROT|nr:lysozyme inhibitor LprI family protein [Azospirillum rugosum]MBP2290605.1 uncharacterized protein YecT (DUF1311 family) [Azospirillum rugosum]MDQ0525493.1 uncharacterized protein YecT (DUF1311 family) [Azospirillum rugosum]